MSDEETFRSKKFGRKINKEDEGYTNVDDDGIARPVLKIPSDIPKGRRRLTAVYTDERQEINRTSLDRTWLIYGSKCYVHCPPIFQPNNMEHVTLIANLFSNNRPVPGGNAIFKISEKTVSSGKIPVVNGHLEETHQYKATKTTLYQCPYEGSEIWKISEARGEGPILVYVENKTPLIVDVAKIIMNKDETGKLVARVYLRNHGTEVTPDEIPSSGTMTFYVDYEQHGDPVEISKNGFATIEYEATHDIGVHTITAVYKPDTDEMKEKYQETSGANTLFIGDDTNRPTLTQVGLNCSVKGEEYVFDFNSSRNLTGKLRIYIDGISINANECVENGNTTFFGNTQTLYEQTVNEVSNFKFTLTIPDYKSNTMESLWGYSGYHNMIIQYLETDTELGDMEYWYYWDDFFVQISTLVYIDDTFMDNTSDNNKYTGNNMYVEESDGTYIHFKPTENQIPHSITVGSPMKIHVIDEDTGEPVKKGHVRVTVTTRKKEKWVD
ncbi:MAG: hypothetical protein J6V44_03695 [Methanobrevibacter sp.]|nr:hypothetical protein [Methanobrevibacter sp.]